MTIRIAQPSDAAGMLEIYAPYIIQTSVTFELEVPAADAFACKIADYLLDWPWLVCKEDGLIAGYAYASRYRERLGYQWSVECSVYVHPSCMRKGVGRLLYKSLFEILKEQGYRNVYAVINLPNQPSIDFHECLGFYWIATYEKVGYKLGQWKDVGWWRLVLNEFNNEPAAPIRFSSLAPGKITGILEP